MFDEIAFDPLLQCCHLMSKNSNRSTDLGKLICNFHTFHNVEISAVFCHTLREIIFEESRTSRIAIYAILGALKYFSFQRVQKFKIQSL